MGNADSRSEVHASLSLENLQARHRQVIRVTEASAEERGEVEKRPALAEATRGQGDSPPIASSEEAAGKTAGGLPGRFADDELDLADGAVGSWPDVAARGPTADQVEPKPDSALGAPPGGDVGAGRGVPPERGAPPSSPSSSPSSTSAPSSTNVSQACGIVRGICGVSLANRRTEEHHQHDAHASDDGEAHTSVADGTTGTTTDEDEG